MRPRFFASMAVLFVIGSLAVAGLSAIGAQEPKLAPQPMGTVEGAPAGGCTPCIVYRGCPAPCNVDKVVTICNPCCGTVQVPIRVPANACEKVRTERDGDAFYHYGRYGVHLTWQNRGTKLVVRYHG
jgi:hypothetical protein